MKNNRKLIRKDLKPMPTPVWLNKEGVLELRPFFLRWWQDVSMQKFGDKEHCLEAAVELGYVWQHRDPNAEQEQYDLIGFDYDPVLYRTSMNVQEDMPLVYQDNGRFDEFDRLWERLLSEGQEAISHGK